MQAQSSLGCVPHAATGRNVVCTTQEKPWGEEQLHLHVLTPTQAKQCGWGIQVFYIFRGNKQLKSDTLCSIISPANLGKPKQGMQQHQAPLVSDMIIGALADQPVPSIPSFPIAPKYSPTPRDFNLPCCDTLFLSHTSLFAPVWAPQPACNTLQPGAPLKLWRGGFIFVNM